MKNKDIGNYIVYVDGRVFSKKLRRFMSGTDYRGYVKMYIDRKHVKRSRMIASAFIDNPENKPQVNHKNGIKNDDRVENLEWVTCAENIRHAYDTGLMIGHATKGSFAVGHTVRRPATKINEFQVKRLRLLKEICPKITQEEVGALFGIKRTTAGYILRRQTWVNI